MSQKPQKTDPQNPAGANNPQPSAPQPTSLPWLGSSLVEPASEDRYPQARHGLYLRLSPINPDWYQAVPQPEMEQMLLETQRPVPGYTRDNILYLPEKALRADVDVLFLRRADVVVALQNSVDGFFDMLDRLSAEIVTRPFLVSAFQQRALADDITSGAGSSGSGSYTTLFHELAQTLEELAAEGGSVPPGDLAAYILAVQQTLAAGGPDFALHVQKIAGVETYDLAALYEEVFRNGRNADGFAVNNADTNQPVMLALRAGFVDRNLSAFERFDTTRAGHESGCQCGCIAQARHACGIRIF